MHKISLISCWRPHPRLIISKMLVTKWSSCVCTGSPWHPRASRTNWQSWQKGERTQWPGPLWLPCVCVCVCSHASVFVVVCASLYGCLYLWPLLKRWEAYFQSNKQLLDMCLTAYAAFNPRINGRPVNLSENAKWENWLRMWGTIGVTVQSLYRAISWPSWLLININNK